MPLEARIECLNNVQAESSRLLRWFSLLLFGSFESFEAEKPVNLENATSCRVGVPSQRQALRRNENALGERLGLDKNASKEICYKSVYCIIALLQQFHSNTWAWNHVVLKGAVVPPAAFKSSEIGGILPLLTSYVHRQVSEWVSEWVKSP